MNDFIFGVLLTLTMVDDPTHLPPHERDELERQLNAESLKRGYDNWIDAYHQGAQC